MSKLAAMFEAERNHSMIFGVFPGQVKPKINLASATSANLDYTDGAVGCRPDSNACRIYLLTILNQICVSEDRRHTTARTAATAASSKHDVLPWRVFSPQNIDPQHRPQIVVHVLLVR